MRTNLKAVVCVVVGLAAGAASAQDAINPKTLAAVKKATVYIKVDTNHGPASGSGFVVKKEEEGGLVATNLHVVYPDELDLKANVTDGGRGSVRPETRPMPKAMAATLKEARVTVVFDSGLGTERSAKAEVIAFDPFNDLAVLKIVGLKNFPEPIAFEKTPEIQETITVYSLGFPFGKALATSERSPAVTVGKSSISSLRMSEDGELLIIQIDGSLNPGNSGGPLVDSQGKLVGVAVATIRDSSGIGLAIPGERLKTAFQGRIGDVRITAGKEKSVDVEVGLVDPLGTIASATLLYLPASKKGDKKLACLTDSPECKKVALKLEKKFATGAFEIDAKEELLTQIVFDTAASKEQTSRIATRDFKKVDVAKAGVVIPPPRRIPIRPRPKNVEENVTNVGKFKKPDADLVAREDDANLARADRPAVLGNTYPDGETDTLGHSFHRSREMAPEKGILIGMELGFDGSNLRAMKPIFRTPKGEVVGKAFGVRFENAMTIKAKAGYAVGAVFARVGGWIDGFYLVYAKVKDDGSLDLNDTYQSEWIGSYGGSPKVIGGTGAPAVGVVATVHGGDNNLIGFGLMMKVDPADAKPAPLDNLPEQPAPVKGATFPSPLVQAREQYSNPSRSTAAFELKSIYRNGETDLVGRDKAPVVRDVAPDDGYLIGVELGSHIDNATPISIKPIFRTNKGEVDGQRHGTVFTKSVVVKAKEGYAVGGLVARVAGDIDGFYLIYMKIKGDGSLDVYDTYQSEWVGGFGGGRRPQLVGGTGDRVVGLLTVNPSQGQLLGLGLMLRK